MVNRKALARANGASRRASGWAGENDARSWDHPSHPVKSDNSLGLCLEPGASQGKESVLADSGRAGEIVAGAGRVRSPAFLSILRGVLLLSPMYRSMKSRCVHRVFLIVS